MCSMEFNLTGIKAQKSKCLLNGQNKMQWGRHEGCTEDIKKDMTEPFKNTMNIHSHIYQPGDRIITGF